jgi:hypothetical protein
VSLLSADRVLLSVGPERLSCVRLTGMRSRRKDEASFALKVRDGAPQFDELSNWLGRSHGRLHVVLSSAWVRYAVMPWQDALGNEGLAEDFARALFNEQFGEISAGWHIIMSPFVPGKSRIAAAVDARWINAIGEFANTHRLKLARIRPSLSAIFNRVSDKLPENALLAVVEPRRLTLLHIENGEWSNLHNRVLPENWVSRLSGFITQASASLGTLTIPLFITAPQYERPELDGMSATWLRLPANRFFDPRRDLEWAFCLGV